MTYKQLQDRILDRTNQPGSSPARDRIKQHLNERYRRLVTAIGLGLVRRNEAVQATANGTKDYTITCVKVISITFPDGNYVLTGATIPELRMLDPDASQTGQPRRWAQNAFHTDGVGIRLHPTPDDSYDLTVDVLGRGTDMSADGDIPAFPEDFHDILLKAGLAEEFMKQEKLDLVAFHEREVEERTRELRYFLAKTAYHHTQQGGGAPPWWWGPYGGVYGW